MLESRFQSELIKELKDRFPGCFIEKGNTDYIQGLPDLTIFYKNKWAKLECKAHANADHQPNQDYYIELFNGMSFAAFIYPENMQEVLYEMEQAFTPRRRTRIPSSE